MNGFISGLSILFNWSIFLFFVTIAYCLDDYSFVVQSKVRKVDSFSSILLSQDGFGYSESFMFPHEL